MRGDLSPRPRGSVMRGPRHTSRSSRLLHAVGDVTSRAGMAVAVTAVVAAFLLILLEAGRRASWQMMFATATGAVTIVMLFVIQHTQQRQQTAIQLKLDELIRSSPRADDMLVHIEVAGDAELSERERDQVARHTAARDA